MEYRSFDPYRQELLAVYPAVDATDFSRLIAGNHQWSKIDIQARCSAFNKLAQVLLENQKEISALITAEMGKPFHESMAEVSKCISAIQYMVDYAPAVLKPKAINSEALSSYLIPEPFGILLAILPWNFPFWQLIRFAMPAMLAGNTVIFKPAPNVPQCAMMMDELVLKAGFPIGSLHSQFFSDNGVADLIRHPLIKGVSFTGSNHTGSLIGSLAGRAIKKTVMELGGNDPMIIFADADLDMALQSAVQSRCINGGQACNGAKRFLIEQSIYHQFSNDLINVVTALRCGDPMDPSTQIGPIPRFDLLEKLKSQVMRAVDAGAKQFVNQHANEGHNWFFPPTVLTDVLPGNPAFEEELFGPVWSLTPFKDKHEAIQLANATAFGLGASIWSSNEETITCIVPEIEAGNIFINDFVRSDARFPFGGVKQSGFGKELGEAGLMEFVNWKTVYRSS
jgi:succinate-semialdehyde dehydrogenase/glutarate-semialdehyde dehydrogenase